MNYIHCTFILTFFVLLFKNFWHTVIRYQVFLSNTNNLHTIICHQVFLSYTYFQVLFQFNDRHLFLYSYIKGGGLCGVMVKAMDCGIVVSEFVLQSCYYVHFQPNTLGKGINPLITFCYFVDSSQVKFTWLKAQEVFLKFFHF